jgi:outer membrane biosynthesis protein TonB
VNATRAQVSVALIAGAVLFAGCGSTAGEITPAASEQLVELVDAARDAAAAGEAETATGHLDALRARVAELRDADEVSGERAEAILAAADDVEARLPAGVEPDPEPEPEPEPEPSDEDDDDEDDDDEDDDEDDREKKKKEREDEEKEGRGKGDEKGKKDD